VTTAVQLAIEFQTDVVRTQLEAHSAKVTDTKPSAPAKKPGRRPRKKNPDPKSADHPRLIDPAQGEGTDRPPTS
jgi:hypothetical protein